MTDEVLVERDDAVLVITMNRPQARNAANGALARGSRRHWTSSTPMPG